MVTWLKEFLNNTWQLENLPIQYNCKIKKEKEWLKVEKLNYRDIVRQTYEKKGSTTPLTNNELNRYAVALPDHELIVSRFVFSPELVELYHSGLPKVKNASLGTWLNMDNEKIYLDLSLTFDDLEEAVREAYNNNQIAIYDLKENQEIRIEIRELD